MLPTAEQIRTLKLADSPTDIDLTNDGKLLAVAARKAKGAVVRVVKTADASVVAEYGEDAAMGWGAAFVDGGKALVYAVRDKSQFQTVYRAKVGLGEPQVIAEYTHSDFRIDRISRNRDGSLFALDGDKTQIRRAKDNEVAHEVEAGKGLFTRSCFDASGKKIWIGGVKKKLVIEVDAASGKVVRELTAPSDACEHIAVSPDDRYLVALGEKGKGIAIWDLGGKKAKRIEKDPDDVFEWNDEWGGSAFAFSQDRGFAAHITVKVEALKLPKWELTGTRPRAAEPGAYMWNAVSAFDAPMMAFAGQGSKSVVWFPLGK